MSGGIVLKPWERRSVMGVSYLGAMSVCMATILGWLVVGPHWVLAAWGAGAALAWTALRADRASRERGGPGSPLRRALARVAGWELRLGALFVGTLASLYFADGLTGVPVEALKGLWDPEVTKAEVAAAFEEARRRAWAKADSFILAGGISGIAIALLSGLTDWMWLLALARRRGTSPWRVLAAGWSRSRLREQSRRERARRRRLLRGEG